MSQESEILITLPSDKSITHRAFILASLSQGQCRLQNVGNGADLASTRRVLQQLGIEIFQDKAKGWIVNGRGFERPFRPSTNPLDCGNSGTTSRLMMGLLGGQGLSGILIGDTSLSQRPMLRVAKLLNQMGTSIECSPNGTMPVHIQHIHQKPAGGQYHTQTSSAQIKSALLLAGLYASAPIEVTERLLSRDHTERFFKALGIQLSLKNQITCCLQPITQPIPSFEIEIPGDFSSACFWITAALLAQKKICIQNVNLNPTRTGFLDIITAMGGQYQIQNMRIYFGEELGDLIIFPSELKGIEIDEALALRAIDELPLFALLATSAHGKSKVEGAKELRVKESDRIEAMTIGLRHLGCSIESTADGWLIEGLKHPQGGDKYLTAGQISSFSDHRIAATFRIARLKAQGMIEIDDEGCVDISYPEFNRLFDFYFMS